MPLSFAFFSITSASLSVENDPTVNRVILSGKVLLKVLGKPINFEAKTSQDPSTAIESYNWYFSNRLCRLHIWRFSAKIADNLEYAMVFNNSLA